jgi:hypothetical protein
MIRIKLKKQSEYFFIILSGLRVFLSKNRKDSSKYVYFSILLLDKEKSSSRMKIGVKESKHEGIPIQV